MGSIGCFDFGAELQAEALLEFVALGAQRLDLISGDGEVGAKAGRRRRVLAGRGWGWAVVGLAASSGVDVFADPLGVDESGGHSGDVGDRGEGDRRAAGFHRLKRG